MIIHCSKSGFRFCLLSTRPWRSTPVLPTLSAREHSLVCYDSSGRYECCGIVVEIDGNSEIKLLPVAVINCVSLLTADSE